MFKVLQIKLNREEIHAINAGEDWIKEKYTAHLQASVRGKVEDTKYHVHVANVDTNDEEEAFSIMNRWEPEDNARVERFGELHSLSVGDILIDEQGKARVCAPCGFKDIELNQ